MAPGLFFAAVFIYSLSPAVAGDDVVTLTTPPKGKRTPLSNHDITKRQVTNTYETTSPLPLTQYKYPYEMIPEQVNPYPVGRGPQTGYNRCNSSTEGPTSQCQTLVVNTLVSLLFGGGSD